MHYFLNIGSNLGYREQNLRQAIEALESELCATAQVSDIIETPAWGFESANSFLNVGLVIKSPIEPAEVLKITQSIESRLGSAMHRNPDGTYCDRAVDIDIIAIDEITINSTALTIPPPRMHLREFVLRPMSQLAPNWTHPILRKTAIQLLEELNH